MKTLVLNCGSSSIKYQFINTESQKVLTKGVVERIGMSGAVLTNLRHDGDEATIAGDIFDHITAIEYILAVLLSRNHGVIENRNEIDAVGHRVVHGGEIFRASVVVNDEVIKGIRGNIELAPLHNPHNLRGIQACQVHLPDTPQVAVFDTAFHQQMPEEAYLYGIPFSLYKQHKIRRYGFHGTSHYYVSQRAAELLGKPLRDIKMATCHLGNGCSITAIKNGNSVDTSMGFTPLEGLLMGTRSGDLDPSVILYIMGKEGLNMAEASTLLNKHSGLLGISGVSSDMREIVEEMKEGNHRAKVAFKLFCYRIAKYLGAYAAAMGGIEAIVFTGGIGENSPDVRRECLATLGFLGVRLDDERNQSVEREKIITTDASPVAALVVPTNEELVIALETARLVKKGSETFQRKKESQVN